MPAPYTTRFSHKAETYARYRWDYAPGAIQMILVAVPPGSVLADIGSGTGILTRHLLAHAKRVYAIEPNPEMRALAERDLSTYAAFCSLPGSAEMTSLPDASVDMITVAQALHWFDPAPTVREFHRIIKPGGWLALLWNNSRDTELGKACIALQQARYGWDTHESSYPQYEPFSFYFGHEAYQACSFQVTTQQTWEQFFGALCSDSHAPLPDHPAFPDFEAAARSIFDDFRQGDVIPSQYETGIVIGPVAVTKNT